MQLRETLLCGAGVRALLVSAVAAAALIGGPSAAQTPIGAGPNTPAATANQETAAAAAQPAEATEPPAPEENADAPETATVDEVVITGSRISRRDALSVGPMTTLTAQDIALTAPSSVGQLIQALPGVGVSLNSNGTQGTSFGVSSVNLRYLGSNEGSGNRTLVLVDGHRWVNAAGGRGFRDFVDLNTIPLGLVESIEVLKDGASAIYGADAIAGVVNIKTRRAVEGIEVSAQAGATSHGDGERFSGWVNAGRRIGAGSLLASLNYAKNEPILTTDRDLTTRALTPLTAPPTSPRGLYVLPGVAARFGLPSTFASTAAPVTRIPGAIGASVADFRTATLAADDYNTLAQGVYAEGASERIGAYIRVRAPVGDRTNFQTDFLINQRTSDQLFSPVLLDIRGSNGITMPVDHPFNPFGVAFNTTAFRAQRVAVEVGNRDNVQEVVTKRFSAGLDGVVTGFGRDWNWDAFLGYGWNDATFDALNQVNLDRVALALGPNARCVANGCTPLNIFGTITREMANYIRFNGHDENGTSLLQLSGNIAGAIMELPAGPLGVAVGVEHRREDAYDRPDPYANTFAVFQNAGQRPTTAAERDPTSGGFDLSEAYAEVEIPLLADLPFAHALDVNAAIRYSNYSTFGDTTTGKVGLAYRPLRDLLLRGTYSQGFRAPSILELFQGRRQTTFQAVDPCNGGAAANPTRPGCAGVPAGYNQNQFGSGTIQGTVAGNINLQPESADTYSLGLAFTPSFLRGLSFTLDWFSIELQDAIAAQSATQILTSCATTGTFCDLVQRQPSGEVSNLTQAVVNLSRLEVEGVDATFRYGVSTPIGDLRTVLDVARLDHFTNYIPQPDGTILVDERAGKSDRPRTTFPHWKAQASVQWERGPYSASWKGRYIGESDDIPNNAVNGGTVDSIVYHDVQAGFDIDRYRANISFGIDNIFDEEPPASAANNPINFDIYTYDVRGRYLYVRVAAKFF